MSNLFYLFIALSLAFAAPLNWAYANDGSLSDLAIGLTDPPASLVIENFPPTAPILNGNSIVENTINVGTLVSVDPNGDPVSFAIVSGADQALFEIVNGNTLAFISAPDFENPQDLNGNNVHNVTVEASDGSSAQEASFKVTVIDVDEVPTAPTISQTSISENTTQVGTLSATDAEGASLSYQIVGGFDGSIFEIVNDNTLAFKMAPDYENPQDHNTGNNYIVRVETSDGINSSDYTRFIVNVTDVNEVPTAPVINQTTIFENSTQVGTLSSTDPEGGAISYSISGGVDQAFFEIINSNVLAFKSAPDFDVPEDSDDDNVYTVIVNAEDGSSSSEGSSFQVTVQDIDEVPSAPSISQTTITENNTQVGTLSSTDPEGESVAFSIVGGADQDLFEIINSNVLAFKSAPDFEDPQDSDLNNIHAVTVEVTDGSSTAQQSAIQVTVQDRNEAPTTPTISQTEIPENTTIVGTLSSTDPDGDALTYYISQGVDETFFEIIDGNVLAFKSAPNFEIRQDDDGNNEYVVRVRSNDGTNLSGNPIFRIKVTDVEETAIEEFRNRYGLAVDGSEDSEDLSGNGVENILYLAFGLGDPNDVYIDRTKIPSVTVGTDGTISYEYRRLVDTTELNYSAHSSFNLVDWVDVDSVDSELTLDSDSISTIDTDYELRSLKFVRDIPETFFSIQVFDPITQVLDEGQNHQPSLALEYYISVDGEYPSSGDLNPAALGEVKLFATQTQPSGYLPADGQLLLISEHVALYSLLGTFFGGDGLTTFALPDLRGRTVIGDGQGAGLTSRAFGEYGGVDEVTLTTAQLPSHSHSSSIGETGLAGSGESHTNMQPYLALNPIIRINGGAVPADGIVCTGEESDGYLAEMKWLATPNVPGGWIKANGQLLPVASYADLYSVIGTTYGGDGRTTFALPDLRGRAVIGAGLGSGLSSRIAGAQVGQESNTLSITEIPAHHHTLVSGEVTGDTGLGHPYSNMMPSLCLNYMLCSTTFEVRVFAATDFIIGLSTDGMSDRPDLRGRIPIGVSNGYHYSRMLGSETTVLSDDDLPEHTHAEPQQVVN